MIDEDLDNYAAILQPALESYLPRWQPDRYLYDLLPHFASRRGKALRSSICMATSAAFGADLDRSLAPAVAIELAHEAFLVHDDVQDGSSRRRGTATLHATVGVPLAINTGDALAALSFRPLFDAEHRLGSALMYRLVREFHHTIISTVEGQAIDLGWRRDNSCDVSVHDYLGMVLRKTCCYTTIHPLRVGALVGAHGRADLGALTRFGFHLGVAFQIRDDVLDLTASPTEYGKDPYGDLYEGKRSLPLLHLLAECRPAERAELVRFLSVDREARSTEEVAQVHSLLLEYGSIDFAREFGDGVARAGVQAFDAAFANVPTSRHVEFLSALTDFVVTRSA